MEQARAWADVLHSIPEWIVWPLRSRCGVVCLSGEHCSCRGEKRVCPIFSPNQYSQALLNNLLSRHVVNRRLPWIETLLVATGTATLTLCCQGRSPHAHPHADGALEQQSALCLIWFGVTALKAFCCRKVQKSILLLRKNRPLSWSFLQSELLKVAWCCFVFVFVPVLHNSVPYLSWLRLRLNHWTKTACMTE